MAKKAKRKLAEDEKFDEFRFPEFDERKFLSYEYEQSIATAIAVGLAILLAGISWEIDRVIGANSPYLEVPWVIGVAGVVAAPFLIRTVRPLASEYKTGDWAWLILTTFMGWLGIWFLLADLFH
jgi:hypothetical protein